MRRWAPLAAILTVLCGCSAKTEPEPKPVLQSHEILNGLIASKHLPEGTYLSQKEVNDLYRSGTTLCVQPTKISDSHYTCTSATTLQHSESSGRGFEAFEYQMMGNVATEKSTKKLYLKIIAHSGYLNTERCQDVADTKQRYRDHTLFNLYVTDRLTIGVQPTDIGPSGMTVEHEEKHGAAYAKAKSANKTADLAVLEGLFVAKPVRDYLQKVQTDLEETRKKIQTQELDPLVDGTVLCHFHRKQPDGYYAVHSFYGKVGALQELEPTHILSSQTPLALLAEEVKVDIAVK